MKLTIFYADDDEDDRLMFDEAVRSISQDVELYTYPHGEKLLSVIANPPPTANLIFLDLNMPGKDGFEVLKELKKPTTKIETPIIIFSTTKEQREIEKCHTLGANYFITKPITMDDLISCIKHALSIEWANFYPNLQEFVYRKAS